MIQGSICPLKNRAIFATNFTEIFVPKKKKLQKLFFWQECLDMIVMF